MWNGKAVKIPGKSLPCDKGARVRLSCYHGQDRIVQVACGDVGECDACMNAWRAKVRRRIVDGCRGGTNLWFLTLTFATDVELSWAMSQWRKLWKEMSRRMNGIRMFRVVELTAKGRPHFHAVVDGPMPAILKPYKGGEYVSAFLARQSPAARSFIEDVLVPHGFGPIAHCERVRLGGRGAASYLSKYLTKSKTKSLVREDGRRVRVAEGSRNWLTNPPVPTYRYGTVETTHREVHDAGCRCSIPRRKMLQPEGKAVDEDALRVWRARLHGLEEEASLYRDAVMATQRAYHKGGELLELWKLRKHARARVLRQHGYNGPLALVVSDRRGQAAIYDWRSIHWMVSGLVSEHQWVKFGKWVEEKPWLLVTPTQSALFDTSAVEALMRIKPSRLLSSPISRGNDSEVYAVTLSRRLGLRRLLTSRAKLTGR